MAKMYPLVEPVRSGISEADVNALARQRAKLAVSIVLPCAYGGWQKPQYALPLASIITRATRRITAAHAAEGERVIDTLWHFSHAHRAPPFCAGLALFAAPSFFRAFALPVDLDEQIVVGDQFYIQPLLPIVADDGMFWLLVLRLPRIALFRCTHWTMVEVPIHLPPTFFRDTHIDQLASVKVSWSGTPLTPWSSVHHGGEQGGRTVAWDAFERYLHAAEHAVRTTLGEQETPLVLAGHPFLVASYNTINTYSYIAGQLPYNDTNGLNDLMIHTSAWEIAKPMLQAATPCKRSQASFRHTRQPETPDVRATLRS
jgi:hypothetical protein